MPGRRASSLACCQEDVDCRDRPGDDAWLVLGSRAITSSGSRSAPSARCADRGGHVGRKRLAAADQEIDDVIAQRVVIGVAVQIDAAAILRQRIFHDFGQHRAGAIGHQENLVGEIDRLIDVVGDHERGLAGLQANAAHLVLQRAAGQRVERRERLVHQHDLWRDRERARDADALLHAAGQFRRTLVLGAGQADEIDEGLRVRLHLGAVPVAPFRGHGIGDVAEHRAPRQQRVALEDHGAVEAGALDRLPVDDDRALARLVEAGQNVQHRGLAAAGMADHAAEFAARHRQPEILEHGDLAAIRAGIAPRDAFDGNELVGHSLTPGT